MAVIGTKSTTIGTEKVLLLNPKEALAYPMGVGDWTRIRVCFMIGYTSLTDSNANMDGFGTPQTGTSTTERDRLFYGITRGNPTFPREANDVFLGIKSYGANTYIDFPQTLFDHRNGHGSEIHIGVHHPNGSKEGKFFDPGINQAYGMVTPSAQNDETSGFAGGVVLAFEIQNKGKANQMVKVLHGQSQITDNRREFLRQQMVNTSLTNYGTFQFNQSGVPYEAPDSIFIYNPIPGMRTRVFGVSVLKEA